jgi:HEPN domain-containing protein
MHLGQEAWGHVITRLLGQLPSAVKAPDDLREKASFLDNLYVPSRYPNGHAEGAPFEHYTQLQSDQAVRYASEIIEFARSQMA